MFHKVVATLPGVLEKDSVYFVRSGVGFDVFVTNHNGGVVNAYPLNASEGSGIEDAPSDGRHYGRLNESWSEIPPISGDLDSLPPANEDFEPLAIAVYQMQDGELYVDEDYVDDEYVEDGVGGVWRKMSFAQIKSWLEHVPPEDVADPYADPDYVDPDYVGE